MSSVKMRFESDDEAVSALSENGFSVGRKQRSDPRGVMFGDYDISKWRNLSQKDKDALDGHLVRHGGPGSVTSVYLHLGDHIPVSKIAGVKDASTPPV